MADSMINAAAGSFTAALGPTPICAVRHDEAEARQADTGTRTAAGESYRATIEALLAKADGAVLADLWREVFPYPVDQSPDRRGAVRDLADFAEVLRPRLEGLQANELCGLIRAYAVKRRKVATGLRQLLTAISAAE